MLPVLPEPQQIGNNIVDNITPMDTLEPAPAIQSPELQPLTEADWEAAKPKVENELAYDYEGAIKANGSPKQILDFITTEYNPDKLTAERAVYGDKKALQMLMTEAEKAKVHRAKYEAQGAGDFKLGVGKAMAGMRAAIADAANWLPYGMSDEEHKKTVGELQEFAKNMDRARNDKDFFSAFTAGDMGMQLAALPVGASSRLASFIIEGALGYAAGRATGTKEEAAVEGALSGTLGAGIAHLLRGFNGLAAERVYKNLADDKLTTPAAEADFEEYYNLWQNTVDIDTKFAANKEPVQRTAALVDYLQKEGVSYKLDAADATIDAARAIKNSSQQRVDAVKDALTNIGTDTIEEVGPALTKAFDTIKEDFSKVLDSHAGVKTDNSKLLSDTGDFSDAALDLLDDATATDLKTIRGLLQDDSIAELLNSKIVINSLIRSTAKTKRARAYKLDNLNKLIDDKLKSTMSPDKFNEYKSINRDYGMMAEVRDSKINKYIQQAVNKEITSEDALRLIHKVSGGKRLFKNIEKLVGTEQAAKLELLTIKDAIDVGKPISWKTLGKQIDNKDFVTPEGKALGETIQNFSKLFKIDDMLNMQNGVQGILQGGAKQDMKNEVLGALVRETFILLQKALPLTRRARLSNSVTNVLKNPQKLKAVMKKVQEIHEPIKHRMVQDIIKQLPAKPADRPGGVQDLTKPAINPAMKTNIMSHDIAQGLQDAYKDSMFSKLANSELNKITDAAFAHFDNTRFIDRIAAVGNAMTADKIAQNTKRLEAVLEHEVDTLVKSIERANGVKLDNKSKQVLRDRELDKLRAREIMYNITEKMIRSSK